MAGPRHSSAKIIQPPSAGRTLARLIAILAVLALPTCTPTRRVDSSWVVVIEGAHATISLDTSRIEPRTRGYRIHIQTQFSEPAYRPKAGGPAYDLGEAIIDIDCSTRQAHSLEATIFDSRRQPVHGEVYQQAKWQDFREHDLGEDVLAYLCRALARVRPRQVA